MKAHTQDQVIRDVPDIQLYPDPVRYPATFHYPDPNAVIHIKKKRIQKPDNFT